MGDVLEFNPQKKQEIERQKKTGAKRKALRHMSIEEKMQIIAESVSRRALSEESDPAAFIKKKYLEKKKR